MMQPNPELDSIIANAVDFSKHLSHEYVTVEHLLYALISHAPFSNLIDKFGSDLNEMKSEIRGYLDNQSYMVVDNLEVPKKTQALERIFNRAASNVLFSARSQIQVIDVFLSILSERESHASYFIRKYGLDSDKFINFYNKHYRDVRGSKPTNGNKAKSLQKAEDILNEHCINLNALADDGKIDPVIGRDAELQEIAEILAKRNKSNVLLVGDPGVGKTVLAEGLARNIVLGDVPEYLEDYTVYNLDIGSVLAGCKYRGEFEEKIKDIIKALSIKGKAILFIDEAHQMRGAGAGSRQGTDVDFSNMIKPALSKGDIKVIASTTWEEYTQSFEKDRALMRRFYRLSVTEPTPETAKKILKGLKEYFEDFHGGSISDEAISAAVDLSVRYQTDKRLPDKAIDLIDTACAKVKLRSKKWRLKKDHIVEVISIATKIPKDQIANEDSKDGKKASKNLQTLEATFKSTVFGQDEVIDTILNRIYVSKAGLKPVGKPIGSFLFTGPTGTGKSLTAKLLSKHLSMPLIRFDMGEYQEKHSVSKLIGSPPGYVGYDDGNIGGGLLVSQVEKNPNCVILFDEIEKAHPDVANVLLSLLDEGFVTSSNGKKADCRNSIIIMTSNLGAAENEKNNFGFAKPLARTGEDDKAIKEFFKPEFRNRIDAICKFNKLGTDSIKKIVIAEIETVNDLLKSSGNAITIKASEEVIDYLIKVGYDPKMGARPLARKVNELITVPLSKKILFDDIAKGSVIHIGYDGDNEGFFTFSVLSKRGAKPTSEDDRELEPA